MKSIYGNPYSLSEKETLTLLTGVFFFPSLLTNAVNAFTIVFSPDSFWVTAFKSGEEYEMLCMNKTEQQNDSSFLIVGLTTKILKVLINKKRKNTQYLN